MTRRGGTPAAKIDVWHNLLWSRYKGHVFSKLHEQAKQSSFDIRFVQIAEFDAERVGLSPVDRDWHRYPFDLLFEGSLARVSTWRLFLSMSVRAWRSDADAVILAGYERWEYWLQAVICRIRRQKIAVFCDSTLNDKPQHLLKGLFKRLFFRGCDAFFCYGQRSGAYVRAYGAAQDKVFIGCQAAALFRDYDVAEIVRRRVDARRQQRLLYLFVGRLAPEKRIEDLLRALQRVLIQAPAAHLVLVGTGPEKNALTALVDTLDLAAAVTFAGACYDDGLIEEYLKASCLILPSRSEPWGLVVNEALSCGCPVLVSDRCGCTPELVAEGAGFSFHCGDIADLTVKMLRVQHAFFDTGRTALSCTSQVAAYTADAAAANILNGCQALQRAD